MVRRRGPLLELTRARWLEFLREPEAIFWVFVFPVLLAGGLGIAFRNRPAESVRVGIIDRPGANEVAAALESAPDIAPSVLEDAEARRALRTGELAMVVIPGDSTTYLFDATRKDSRLARLKVDDAIQRAAGRTDPKLVRDRRLTEPGSRYIDFLIPGLLGMNLMGSGMWGIGFNLVQTRRRKLLKRYLATPMRKSHFLASFMLSRLLFMVLEVAVLVGFGWAIFGVRVHGSLLDLIVVSIIGALAFAGLLAGVCIRHQDRILMAIDLAPVSGGDVNGDGMINITDAVFLLNFLVSGGGPPAPLLVHAIHRARLWKRHFSGSGAA